MNQQLQQLQNEMNTILRSLMSRGILTQQVYNRFCSEYAVKFTKLLATYGIKQSVSFVLTIEYHLPEKAGFLHTNVSYDQVRNGLNFFSRTI